MPRLLDIDLDVFVDLISNVHNDNRLPNEQIKRVGNHFRLPSPTAP